MKLAGYVIVASALGMIGTCATASPAYLKLEGIDAQAEQARSKSALNQLRTNEQQAEPRSEAAQAPGKARVVAAPNTSSALLLPAIQRVRATGDAETTQPAAGNQPRPSRLKKNSRTVIRIDLDAQGTAPRAGSANNAPRDIDDTKEDSAGLLLPAVQKSGSAPNTSDPVPATSTQGPYQLRQANPPK